MMATTIVPSQHSLGHILRTAQAENALHVGRLNALIVGIVGAIVVQHPAEEPSWRELFAISDDHNLLGAGYGAQGINRRNLTRLVNQQQIELYGTRFEILSDRNRAHHEHGLDCLNGSPCLSKELPDRQMAALLLNLPSNQTYFANIGPSSGDPLVMGMRDFLPS